VVSQSHTFLIVQAWDGGYTFNSNLATCVNQAWAAGMSHIDVYGFFCPNCQGNYDPASAISSLVSSINSVGLSFGTATGQGHIGMLWIDVEQCSGCWNDVGVSQQTK
jgi:hypothetical protein